MHHKALLFLNCLLFFKDFRKGVHNYLDNLKYSNAKTEQLWQYLSESSGMKVDELMNSWTKKDGFPVVSVKILWKIKF